MTLQVGGGRVGTRSAQARVPGAIPGTREIPGATVARLALYLRGLTALTDGGRVATTISSEELAQASGVNSATLRKDLSFLGSHGIRGVGYDVGTLTEEITRTLGAHQAHRVALVGLGNLGLALAGYAGFAGRGFLLSALFDSDPGRIGQLVGSGPDALPVSDIADAATICRARDITIGMIAVPADAAQAVADTLVDAGVRSILTFAPETLSVPADVEVRHVDLALELQMLAFHEARRRPPGPTVRATATDPAPLSVAGAAPVRATPPRPRRRDVTRHVPGSRPAVLGAST
ncbi:redox-sensing transcriptional repressor Rex [Nakamurella flava]|uniref:redox-sensing transcriptional repressor Rex n=1 Tax=Nakamurella flava TaxID=2576308 RepID=UPI001F0FE2E6|nr:redox-sensing transcriptional repressor Rex [Nakamurella flava]